MPAAERLLAAARKAFFGPFRVSVMLDPNGCNTTAAAAVVKLVRAGGGDVRGAPRRGPGRDRAGGHARRGPAGAPRAPR